MGVKEVSPQPRVWLAVGSIAYKWVSYGGQVDPNLVSSSGSRPDFQEGVAVVAGFGPVPGGSRLPTLDDSHPLSVPRMAKNGAIDDGHGRLWNPVHQGQITLAHLPRLELVRQLGMGSLVLGDHYQSRGVLVQSVHDARPSRSAETIDIGAKRQHRVDQCTVGTPRSRMNCESGRLIYHQQVLVLIDDVEGDGLWDEVTGLGPGD